MSATTAAPAEADRPDPDRAVPPRLDAAGTGNLLRLVRALIAYGRNLVETLRQNDDPEVLPWYALLTRIFGTSDPALITITVIRGLLRATALLARFGRRTHLPPLPSPDWAANQTNAEAKGPGRRQPRAAGWAIPPGWPAAEPSLDRQPSPEEEMFAEIVAEDRDRPIGAILLDICLDLGIVAALTHPAMWDELVRELTLYGGDPATLIARSNDLQNSADPASLAAVGEAHSTAGTPAFTPPAFTPLGDPILVSPPWLAAFAQSPIPPATGPP